MENTPVEMIPRATQGRRYAVGRRPDSHRPHIRMAGDTPLLVVDRRAIPLTAIADIVEDRDNPHGSIIHMTSSAGAHPRKDLETGDTYLVPHYLRVSYSFDEMLEAFIPLEELEEVAP